MNFVLSECVLGWFGLLGWALFTFVTLGFGAFYAQKKQIQFIYEHTHFESNG